MKDNKTIRVLTAVPLGIVAFLMLLFVPSAHITMCMACAVGYSIGLPIDKYENTINKVVSFLSGGILFYTIYTGSTFLLLDWFGPNPDPEEQFSVLNVAFIYHTIINIALLVMFMTKKDRIEYVLGGIEAFMIGAPIMILIQNLFGRDLWGGLDAIIVYVVIGLIIFIVHRLTIIINKNFYLRAMLVFRKLVIFSLYVYLETFLLLIPFGKTLRESASSRINPEEENNQQGGYTGIKGIQDWKL